MRAIQASGRRSTTGKLFDATLTGAGIPRGPRGDLVRPQGLYLFIEAGAAAAGVTLRVGAPEGGGAESRVMTLTRSGAWLSVAGWDTVTVIVDTVGAADVVVGYAWTTQQPPSGARLLLVETIPAGTAQVPRGAQAVQGNTADASWAWVSNPAGVALTVANPLPAAGAQIPVAGDQYTATVPNTLVWELLAP